MQNNFCDGDNVHYREMSIRLGLHRAGLESMSSANLHNYLTKIQKMKKVAVSENLKINIVFVRAQINIKFR